MLSLGLFILGRVRKIRRRFAIGFSIVLAVLIGWTPLSSPPASAQQGTGGSQGPETTGTTSTTGTTATTSGAPDPGTGLTAEYFDGALLTNHKVSRIDAKIDQTLVVPSTITTGDGYSIRWSGRIKPRYTGSYTISAYGDGFGTWVVRVNGQLTSALSRSPDIPGGGLRGYVVGISLTADQLKDIVVESDDWTLGAIYLTWDSTGQQPYEIVPTERLYPIIDPKTPSGVEAVSTGAGKVTMYWDGVGSSTGYNLYRSLTPTGHVYAAPVNTSPTNELSYANGETYLYTDVGLSNGVEYFYTTKTVYANPVTGTILESTPTLVDSDIVDPEAVPWDSRNPSEIISAIEAYSDVPFDPEAMVRVMGPDGAIYTNYSGTQERPDALPSPDTNFWALRDGTYLATMAEELGDPTGTTAPVVQTGPVRRLRSQTGYVKCSGRFLLPSRSNVTLTPWSYAGESRRVPDWPKTDPITFSNIPWSTSDVPYIYLGSTAINGFKGEIDAGLVYQLSQGQYYWRPFMRWFGQKDPLNIPTDAEPSGVQLRFEPGSEVEMTYFFQRPTAVQTTLGRKKSNVILMVTSLTDPFDLPVVLAEHVSHPPIGANVRMKRCFSTAQSLLTSSADFTFFGYRTTGSVWTGHQVQNVRLYPTAADPTGVLWTTARTFENLVFPHTGIVKVNPISPNHYEVNCGIDL